jgi:hypothetical protein
MKDAQWNTNTRLSSPIGNDASQLHGILNLHRFPHIADAVRQLIIFGKVLQQSDSLNTIVNPFPSFSANSERITI